MKHLHLTRLLAFALALTLLLGCAACGKDDADDTGETVGYIGVYEEEDNLEFYVFREYRRRLYCSEAVGAFIKAYLSGVLTGTLHDRVIAETLWENGPAAEMLKRVGFVSDAVGFKLSENRENNITGTWRLKYE